MSEEKTKTRFHAAAKLLGCTLEFDADSLRTVPYNFVYEAKVRFCTAYLASAPRRPIALAPLILEVLPTQNGGTLLNAGPIRPEMYEVAKTIRRDFGSYMDWLRAVQLWRLSALYDQANIATFLRNCAILIRVAPLPKKAERSLIRSALRDPRADEVFQYGHAWRYNGKEPVFPHWLQFARESAKLMESVDN